MKRPRNIDALSDMDRLRHTNSKAQNKRKIFLKSLGFC